MAGLTRARYLKRTVASDHCVSEVVGEAVGNAPGARGHVDCVEIVKGKDARVSAVPRLLVVDDRVKLTHGAAIGKEDGRPDEAGTRPCPIRDDPEALRPGREGCVQ